MNESTCYGGPWAIAILGSVTHLVLGLHDGIPFPGNPTREGSSRCFRMIDDTVSYMSTVYNYYT